MQWPLLLMEKYFLGEKETTESLDTSAECMTSLFVELFDHEDDLHVQAACSYPLEFFFCNFVDSLCSIDMLKILLHLIMLHVAAAVAINHG